MELRDHHLGRISTQTGPNGEVRVDAGALLRRLLLFEKCTVESIELKELSTLIDLFGYKGITDLIESGDLNIVMDAVTAGQIGQTDLQVTRDRGGPLPFGSYRLATISLADGETRDKYVHDALQEAHNANVSFKEAVKLKGLIAPRLLRYPIDAANAGVSDTVADVLQQKSSIWSAIRLVVNRDGGVDLGAVPQFEVVDLGNGGDFRIQVHFSDSQLTLPGSTMHSLVQGAILAASGVNQRIHYMQSFGAVSGFQDDEYPLFESRIEFLMRQLRPESHEERFDRVITLTGLPDINENMSCRKVDVKKLLKVRQSEECKEFRAWLRGIDQTTDEEIERRVTALRGRVAEALTGDRGRTVRFAVTTGSGFVPIVGPVLGPALSAADSFLVDRLLGRPGPTIFLSSHYPSVFSGEARQLLEGDASVS